MPCVGTPTRPLSPILSELLIRGALVGYTKRLKGGHDFIDPRIWQDGASWKLNDKIIYKEGKMLYQLNGCLMIEGEDLQISLR